jgi:hypothetical protein
MFCERMGKWIEKRDAKRIELRQRKELLELSTCTSPRIKKYPLRRDLFSCDSDQPNHDVFVNRLADLSDGEPEVRLCSAGTSEITRVSSRGATAAHTCRRSPTPADGIVEGRNHCETIVVDEEIRQELLNWWKELVPEGSVYLDLQTAAAALEKLFSTVRSGSNATRRSDWTEPFYSKIAFPDFVMMYESLASER